MNNRHDHIRSQLDWLESAEIIGGWSADSPDGKRWHIWILGSTGWTFNTREMEVWISGVLTAHTAMQKIPHTRRFDGTFT